MTAMTHQPYYVLSVEGEVVGRVTSLHFKNPARAEKLRAVREQTTGIEHAVFFQQKPNGPKVRILVKENHPCL